MKFQKLSAILSVTMSYFLFFLHYLKLKKKKKKKNQLSLRAQIVYKDLLFMLTKCCPCTTNNKI